jgi:hypothetical protein
LLSSQACRAIRVKVETGQDRPDKGYQGATRVGLAELLPYEYSLGPLSAEMKALPLIWLENHSPLPVHYSQVGCPEQDVLPPGTGRCFAWDQALVSELEDDPFSIELSLYTCGDPRRVGAVCAISPLRDMGLVLELAKRGEGVPDMLVADMAVEGIAKVLRIGPRAQAGHDAAAGPLVKALDVRVVLPGLILSIVDERPEEVMVVGLVDVEVRGARARGDGALHAQLTVRSIQVDNHVPEAHFPVVLGPVEALEGASSPHPCLTVQVHVERRPGLTHLKRLHVKLRKIFLNLDQSAALVVQRASGRTRSFVRKKGPPTLRRSESGGVTGRCNPLPDLVPDAPGRGKTLYVEVLRIEALVVNLSLSRPRESPETVYVGLKLNRMVTDMMHRLDEARLRLRPFVLAHMVTSPAQILFLCQQHYSREVKSHVLSMLGSLRALGKPVALLRGFGRGAQDFIAEPLQGLFRSVEELNPEKFVEGVGRGADSLLRHTVGGMANSASCITDNLSKQIANLAFDKEYKMQRERRDARKEKPSQLLDGLGSGGKSFVKGIADGIIGVVSAPIRGAERDGLRGLVKGVGKGVLGLVIKPVVGVTDGLTDVLQGVQGTAGAFVAEQLPRLRPTRALYGPDRRLRAYDLDDAQAQFLLRRVAGFADDCFEDHVDLGSCLGLISSTRLVFLNEHGALREVLPLADVFFVELAEMPDGKAQQYQAGVILHYHVKLAGGETAARRLLVPCDSTAVTREFKYKVDQALLARSAT